LPDVKHAELAYYALWVAIVIVAAILQVAPVLLVVTMLSLAVGFSRDEALYVMPLVFLAMVYLSCVIAAKFAGPPAARPRARTGSRYALPDSATSAAEFYGDEKRLG
jgi:hypothetical protein